MTHSEILAAIAEGKQLQASHTSNPFCDISSMSVLEIVVSQMRGDNPHHVFRIKPEVRPDVVLTGFLGSDRASNFTGRRGVNDNVVATFDGETNALKSVRMVDKPCPEKMEALLYTLLDQLTSDSYRAFAQNIQVVLDEKTK